MNCLQSRDKFNSSFRLHLEHPRTPSSRQRREELCVECLSLFVPHFKVVRSSGVEMSRSGWRTTCDAAKRPAVKGVV